MNNLKRPSAARSLISRTPSCGLRAVRRVRDVGRFCLCNLPRPGTNHEAGMPRGTQRIPPRAFRRSSSTTAGILVIAHCEVMRFRFFRIAVTAPVNDVATRHRGPRSRAVVDDVFLPLFRTRSSRVALSVHVNSSSAINFSRAQSVGAVFGGT